MFGLLCQVFRVYSGLFANLMSCVILRILKFLLLQIYWLLCILKLQSTLLWGGAPSRTISEFANCSFIFDIDGQR